MSEHVENARLKRDQLASQLRDAKIEAAEASALNATATKAEKVEAAKAAAAARARVQELNAELKAAEKDLAKAEKLALKRAKAEAVTQRLEAAQEDPFQAFEVDWTALGKWLGDRARNRACYVEGAGWGEWTGTHWQFARKPSATLLDRVRAQYADKEGQVAMKVLSNPRGALYMLEHAQGELTLDRSLFNAPRVAHLVAFRNVTVNLKTGKTMPHDPGHYMTGSLQCEFDESADLDRVLTAFARFWPRDPETAEMFQTALGYSLTGETSAKRVFFMVGNQENALENGDNGKSLVQNALARVFGMGTGGWGTAVKSSLIVDTGDRDANSHDGAKTPLIWKRYAMASEFRHGASIDSGELNRLTGGDEQTARPPHGETSVPFVNFASLWFSMNTVPRFKSWDKATRLRLTPFPFTETFWDPGCAPEGDQEKELGLKEWLETDNGMKALGLYLVRGAMRFYAQNGGVAGNLKDTPAVAQLRDQILAEANPFADMFRQNFVFTPHADTTEKAVHKLLSDELGRRPQPSEKELFIRALAGCGVVQKKLKGDRYYRGVALTDAARRAVQVVGMACPEVWRKPGGDVVQLTAAE